LLLAATVAAGAPAFAQQYPPVGDRQFPLNQMTPPGTVAQWAGNAGRFPANSFQPIRVSLPDDGKVTFFEAWDRPVELPAPSQASLVAGRVYRMKISGLKDEFAGIDFYPSIELIDRLHPPTGREDDFPVDFEFTTEELEWAANGRLVTKVIYLEQPNRVPLTVLEHTPRIITIEPSRNALAEADALGRPVAIVRLGGRTPDPNRPEPNFFAPGGPIRPSRKAAPVPAGQTTVQKSGKGKVQQVQFTDPNCPPLTIQQCPPDPRWPAPDKNPFAMGTLGCLCETTALAEKYPDEYLCDGGDRDRSVHYNSFERHGLDTEDTVAEFTDHTGKERVRASNRVCLYAPRFSTVRTVSRPHEGMNLNEIARVGQAVGFDQVHTRLKPSFHTKNEMTGRMRVRSRASGLESEQIQGNVSNIKRLAIHEKLLNTYQDLTFVQFGKIETADAARLNYGIKASMVWSREQYPVIAAKLDGAMTGTYEAHAATIVGVDDKGSDKPGDLRVVKLADKETGQTGDIVEFTIRYDNIGENTVHHVRVVDNLTPRLAYVDDSAQSDREGRLVVEDNGEGSLVLIWELTKPLPPKTGGVVSFKARIR
jgi:uncharacterized repeat protein (TIGR01451 family)